MEPLCAFRGSIGRLASPASLSPRSLYQHSLRTPLESIQHHRQLASLSDTFVEQKLVTSFVILLGLAGCFALVYSQDENFRSYTQSACDGELFPPPPSHSSFFSPEWANSLRLGLNRSRLRRSHAFAMNEGSISSSRRQEEIRGRFGKFALNSASIDQKQNDR